MNEKRCPKCGYDLKETKNSLVCLNKICDHEEEIIHENVESILDNVDELFYKPAFDLFYPLLAYEYYVLYQKVKKRNYDGAIIKYKDICEVLLKFPTLIAINQLWQKSDKDFTKTEKEIFEIIISCIVRPTLGSWKTICEKLIKSNKNKLGELLKTIQDFYEKESSDGKNILAWRNDEIGHGALYYNLAEDIVFLMEFKQRLIELKTFFEKKCDLLRCIEIYTPDKTKLAGCSKENVYIPHSKVQIVIDGKDYGSPYPFILVKGIIDSKKTTDLFDSFYRERIYILSYVRGKKSKDYTELNKQFRNRCMKYNYDKMLESGSTRISDEIHKGKEVGWLISGSDDKDDFEVPRYILNDIKKFIDNNPKGIMFLQMSRGLGKTTLIRAIDQLAMNIKYKNNPLFGSDNNDIIIRAYYINDVENYKLSRFEIDVSDALRTQTNNSNPRYQIPEQLILTKGIDRNKLAERFAGFLNKAIETYMVEHSKEIKLLFIVDGLDEMKIVDNKESIFDCIPDNDLLKEGVYILLTGRTSSEISKSIASWYPVLEKNAKNAVIRYEADCEGNTTVLSKYLAKHLKRGGVIKNDVDKLSDYEKSKIDLLIREGNHRFLHVKALKEVINKADDFSLDTIDGSGSSIISYYLCVLKDRYGDGSYYENIKQLLHILALLNEPVTISELAYLCDNVEPDEKKPTMIFIGYINSLRGLLFVDRTGINEMITFHEEWRQFILCDNEDKLMLDEILTTWINELVFNAGCYKDDNDFKINDDFIDGESYLAANLYGILKKCGNDKMEEFYNGDLWKYLFYLALHIEHNSNYKRAIQIYSSILNAFNDIYDLIEIYEYNGDIEIKQKIDSFHLEGTGDIFMSLVRIRLGITSVKLRQVINAYESSQLDSGIGILKSYYEYGDLDIDDTVSLARALCDRATIYLLPANYSDYECVLRAILDCNESIEIWTNIDQKYELRDSDKLSFCNSFLTRANAYQHNEEYEKAIYDHNVGIKGLEYLYSKGTLDDISTLSGAYTNRANTYAIIKEYEKSIADYNSSINLLESKNKNVSPYHRNTLATSLMNRGRTFFYMSKPKEALVDFEKSVEILKQLEIEESLYNEIVKGMLHIDIGRVLDALNKYDRAISEYEEGIEILVKLYHEGKFNDIRFIAMSYIDKGDILKKMGRYKFARNEYSNVIKLFESYNNRNRNNYDIIAYAYKLRCEVLLYLELSDDAKSDINECINILELLKYEGNTFDENLLSDAYAYKHQIEGALS